MNREEVVRTLQANGALLERYSVRSLSLFGSIVRDEAGPASDVDLLVEFEPGAEIGLFEFVALRAALGEVLGVPVDLATPDALHPALKEDILREARRIA